MATLITLQTLIYIFLIYMMQIASLPTSKLNSGNHIYCVWTILPPQLNLVHSKLCCSTCMVSIYHEGAVHHQKHNFHLYFLKTSNWRCPKYWKQEHIRYLPESSVMATLTCDTGIHMISSLNHNEGTDSLAPGIQWVTMKSLQGVSFYYL